MFWTPEATLRFQLNEIIFLAPLMHSRGLKKCQLCTVRIGRLHQVSTVGIEPSHELRDAGIEPKKKALLGGKARRHKAFTNAQGAESWELSPTGFRGVTSSLLVWEWFMRRWG